MPGSSRSDRPALTDEAVRNKRARAILRTFEQATGKPVPDDERPATIRWLESCLIAHEVDTLNLLCRP